MEILTVIKCPAAWGCGGAWPDPSIIGAHSSCVSLVSRGQTLFRTEGKGLGYGHRAGFCTLVLFISSFSWASSIQHDPLTMVFTQNRSILYNPIALSQLQTPTSCM